MSKTICKCGAVYEHADSLPDSEVDACGQCCTYARQQSYIISMPLFFVMHPGACITSPSKTEESEANTAPHKEGAVTESQGKSPKDTE